MLSLGGLLKRSKGFTVIELVVALALAGVISLILLNVLGVSNNFAKSIDGSIDLSSEGKFALEYILSEIHQATRIVAIDGLRIGKTYPDNIGFIIESRIDDKTYGYSFYYASSGSLIRLASQGSGRDLNKLTFSGYNKLMSNCLGFKGSSFDPDTGLVILSLNLMGTRDTSLVRTLYVGDE